MLKCFQIFLDLLTSKILTLNMVNFEVEKELPSVASSNESLDKSVSLGPQNLKEDLFPQIQGRATNIKQ